MPRVLVIDDDRAIALLVRSALKELDVEVDAALDSEEGMRRLRDRKPDVLVLDIMLPHANGIELAKEIRGIDVRLPVIFVTGLNDSDTAIEAMKFGAYEYLLKPLDVGQLRSHIVRALETRRLMNDPVRFDDENQDDAEAAENGDSLVGRSPKMLEVYKQIGRIAAQNVTVLIRGESGTGKELIARAIYHHSNRADQCFMAVNCAALHDTLLESELFGHEKGAFTGADRRHIGRFEQCNDGTIFLDEVGDMSPATQSKVLRLLQEQRFERVGGHETIATDVRLISATNRELEEMIETGEFRLDLYHRLDGFEIVLPPLRERQGDVDLLLKHFLRRLNRQLGKNVTGVSPEALGLLENYRWPGNVRELQSVVQRALLMATGPTIVPELLPPEILNPVDGAAVANDLLGGEAVDLAAYVAKRYAAESENLYAEALQYMERYLVTFVLRGAQGNQSQAAKRLGITRGSLRNKIRELGIAIESVIDPGEPN